MWPRVATSLSPDQSINQPNLWRRHVSLSFQFFISHSRQKTVAQLPETLCVLLV